MRHLSRLRDFFCILSVAKRPKSESVKGISGFLPHDYFPTLVKVFLPLSYPKSVDFVSLQRMS